MSYKIGDNVRFEHPLKREIYKQGYTIGSFADKADINRWTLNSIFKGAKPRGDTIYNIAKGLNRSYEEVEELCK